MSKKPIEQCGLVICIPPLGGTSKSRWCVLPKRPRHTTHLLFDGTAPPGPKMRIRLLASWERWKRKNPGALK